MKRMAERILSSLTFLLSFGATMFTAAVALGADSASSAVPGLSVNLGVTDAITTLVIVGLGSLLKHKSDWLPNRYIPLIVIFVPQVLDFVATAIAGVNIGGPIGLFVSSGAAIVLHNLGKHTAELFKDANA